MPEPFGVTIGIAGIILIGLIFTAINLVKDAGRFIGLGLLGFVLLILLNRAMSPSGNLNNPGTNPNSTYPNPNASNYPDSNSTYPNPNSTYPNPNASNYPNSSSPNASTSPVRRSPSPSFSLDSVSKGISDFAKSVSKGLDRFVYGDPNAVESPSNQQADGQRIEPNSSQAELPPEQQGYQIRPDGVPSRVSTLVVPDSSATDTSGVARSRAGAGRPVSAWW